MPSYPFETWDIFTTEIFGGNPLAIVFGADDLSAEQMQKIASEFNLSETTFVCAPDTEDKTSMIQNRVRIFTPDYEMPFAGHPTVGTALAIARRETITGELKLALNAGIFPVKLEQRDGVGYAGFVSPNAPCETATAPSIPALAKALGLAVTMIDHGDHRPRQCGAGGVNYVYVCASAEGVRKAAIDSAAWKQLDLRDVVGVYLYTDECDEEGSHWHARMFAPGAGVPEDPATGSAATSFPAQLALADTLSDGEYHWLIEQGYEMNRPSQIEVDVIITDGSVSRVRVSGYGVPVSSGVLTI